MTACADGEAAQKISQDLDVVDVTTATGGTTDGQVIAQVSAQVCHIERTTLETAIAAYEAVVGRTPTSEAELLDAQMIREESTSYDLTPAGALVPAPGSTCR